MGVSGIENHDQTTPLLLPRFSESSSHQTVDSSLNMAGNTWTALAHIITAAIGSGVLSLAWSMAQLGWIAGPLIMLVFASVALTSALLLTNCHKSPDPDYGPTRNGSYLEAVHSILGKRKGWLCGIIVQLSLVKLGIVYTITSAISMRAIQKLNCYHHEGREAACEYELVYCILLFGIVQSILSQIPNFRNTVWLSIIAATMSFAYSSLGSALSLAKIIENGEVKGSITGLPASTAINKVWLVAQALGDIAFAFPFSTVFLEIQDTLREPPLEKITMKRASKIAAFIIAFFYLCCGGFGFAAFGNSTPGNLLTGLEEPFWLVIAANACVIVHLLGAYQLFSQPLFANVERWFTKLFPDSGIIHNEYNLKLASLPALRVNLLRLIFRTAYVAATVGVAIIFPYFNQVIGVAGAIFFWPVVVYFPVEMYLVQKNIGCWTSKWVMLRTCSIFFLAVMIFAFGGSVKGLLTAKFG